MEQQWGIPWSNNGVYYGATKHTMEHTISNNGAYYGAIKHTMEHTISRKRAYMGAAIGHAPRQQ